jgi:hypothetical protein
VLKRKKIRAIRGFPKKMLRKFGGVEKKLYLCANVLYCSKYGLASPPVKVGLFFVYSKKLCPPKMPAIVRCDIRVIKANHFPLKRLGLRYGNKLNVEALDKGVSRFYCESQKVLVDLVNLNDNSTRVVIPDFQVSLQTYQVCELKRNIIHLAIIGIENGVEYNIQLIPVKVKPFDGSIVHQIVITELFSE